MTLNLTYDAGYFDKDEQGWCSRNVAISQEGNAVTVREWGDDNGARPYDGIKRGEIGSITDDLITFTGELARHVFDRKAQRLEFRPYEVRPFAPPANHLSAAFVGATVELVLNIAFAIGRGPQRVPEIPEWPAAVDSTTCAGAREAWLRLPLERDQQLILMRRELAGFVQLCIEIPDAAQVAIWQADKGHVLYSQRPEADGRVALMIELWKKKTGVG